MQPTTGAVGSSRARVIYHTPGKSFAWLHKDGSFADFRTALRVRLNISDNESLVIKQIDGDYTLDIETEEEYEAFCHFTKSASQLHISVNGGMRNGSKTSEGVATSSSANVSTVFPSDPVHLHPLEPEDPALGKRKASQITIDPEAVPPVNQKRKKRRKVGSDRSISVAATPTVTVEPLESEEGRKPPGEMTHDVPSTSAATDANQLTVSPTQKKRKRKRAKSSQSDSTSVDLVEQRVEESTEVTSAPEPPPAEAPKTKKRKKTVVLDLSTVILPPAVTQESSPFTTGEVFKKPSAKKKAKTLSEPSEPAFALPPVPLPTVADGPVVSSATTKPKPPVSKSGLPRPQAYVEIITKKRKTGETDGSSAVKESKQQDPVKKPVQPVVGKLKGNPRKSKNLETPKRIKSPNAPSIRQIMDGVIAAAMEDAKKRASSGGTTTDISENLTPPPQNKSESTIRKLGFASASSLGAASSATLLDAAPVAPNPDSIAASVKVRGRVARRTEPYTPDSDWDGSISVGWGRDDSPALLPTFKGRDKLSTLLTAPPPNQKVTKKILLAKTELEESTSSEDEDPAPKKKPAPVTDPDDELDAFLHGSAHPSQKSVLEELPSDSEDDEEEVEREDMEANEEEEVLDSKGFRHGRSKLIARARSSSDDDSDSESVVAGALVKGDRDKVSTQVTRASETLDAIPSPNPEDEGEPFLQPMKSTNTSTNVAPPDSSAPDSPGPHMTPISNLKSADQALNFFVERVLDKPDPIEDDPPRSTLPEDTEDPIENVDTTSTPKPTLVRRMKGQNKTINPNAAQENCGGSKTTQSSLTSPMNSMLPPPTPSRDLQGDLTLGKPLDQSTPAVPNASRKKQPVSKITVPENSTQNTWTTLSQMERSTQSTDDPPMIDELISSPNESVVNLRKTTPMKEPLASGSVKQTPLFLPGTSQYPIPSSDLPATEELSSEREEEEEREQAIVPPSSRVLRSNTQNKTITPYRSLSVLANQRSIFPSTPIEPAPANNSQIKLRLEEEEDSGVSDSDSGSGSDSPPPSHIPKGRRAGAENGGRGKRRSQLAMWS